MKLKDIMHNITRTPKEDAEEVIRNLKGWILPEGCETIEDALLIINELGYSHNSYVLPLDTLRTQLLKNPTPHQIKTFGEILKLPESSLNQDFYRQVQRLIGLNNERIKDISIKFDNNSINNMPDTTDTIREKLKTGLKIGMLTVGGMGGVGLVGLANDIRSGQENIQVVEKLNSGGTSTEIENVRDTMLFNDNFFKSKLGNKGYEIDTSRNSPPAKWDSGNIGFYKDLPIRPLDNNQNTKPIQ